MAHIQLSTIRPLVKLMPMEYPEPVAFVKLRNGTGRICNRFRM
ncbi:Uncharacterised protein [Mycobacteroides abscessus subsp. abscessus]|nr:Uncharacterised protein [Mycobacteroides abscessus subsp. abscessus]